jgi:hypothetical protein
VLGLPKVIKTQLQSMTLVAVVEAASIPTNHTAAVLTVIQTLTLLSMFYRIPVQPTLLTNSE